MQTLTTGAFQCHMWVFPSHFRAFLFLCLFLPTISFSQSSQLADYVILAGDSTCAQPGNCDVSLGRTNVVLGGNIGSHTNISTSFSLNLQGSLYARNETHIFTDAQISGNIWSANGQSISQNVMTVGHRANISGDLFINGNALIHSGTVQGQLTHPSGSTYKGPTPQNGELISQPQFAPLPHYPHVNNLPATGSISIKENIPLLPGAYDSIALRGHKEIIFSGVGDYVFSAIQNSGYINTFTFDFQNAPTGNIRLLIHGDVDLGKLKVNIINGGSASRIYAETHGTGSSSSDGKTAWTQAAGWIGQNKYSEWKGTVWAPFGGITIGQSTSQTFTTGALFSSKFVNLKNGVTLQHAPFVFCDSSLIVKINTPDSITCSQPSVTLQASTNAVNASYNWHTANGNILSGANTLNPTVNKGGLYTLTVSLPGGCSKSISVWVPQKECIIPYYPPPFSGKSPNPTGSELGSLIDNINYNDTAGNIFILENGSVYIEVIAIQGQYQTLLNLLQTPPYGLTNIIDNGPASLTITGLFPIQNLSKLDSLPTLINYVRPLFPPVVNSGIALSQGDKAMRAPFARLGYNIAGEGVKVGVLSNSYNTQPGNKAQVDVLNEDLPGTGNTKNPTPVQVLQDFPFGIQSDEGRAMLQIIHDVAPKAELAFTTGFLSAGNMAKGILDLAADSCDIIVDDITFITEPFLTDGIIAQTVNAVSDSGVSYFSSAGNFGEKSYAASFNPAPTPANIVGDAHDFGGGDIFQSVTLEPGNYTIVLQWQDSVYSIGQTSTGTNNDLDIYLTDDFGNTLFGFNRNNLQNDPIEIMPFTVTQHTQSNILIVRESGSQNVFFKYIVFQGDITINEYQSGTSTIVGHPNAEGAMAVGAVLYSNSPEFGNAPSIASFSSRGGTPVNGVVRNKPEFTAPNGVNTTVNLGGPNIEADAFPNFFGTSAAAPHAAGVAALLKSAQAKFENHNATPAEIKNLLINSSIDMGTSGFDYESGSGFIQADQAILSFANPKPVVSHISFLDTTQNPGIDTAQINIVGNYFTPSSIFLLRDDTIAAHYVNSSNIEVALPPFTGNPAIRIHNPPISSSLLDGGFSDTLLLFSPIKKTVEVIVESQTKKYSEAVPSLTFYVLVDSVNHDSAGYTLADLGLDSLKIFTTANSSSNVGVYLIRAQMDSLNLSDPFERGLSELFSYKFYDATLTINPMPLTIKAKDTTVEYGYPLGDFQFTYFFEDSLVSPAELSLFKDSISYNHQSNLTNAVALVTRSPARGRALVNADLLKLSFAASGRALVNARASARGRALVNGAIEYDTTYFVDISEESVFDYQLNPDSATFFDAIAKQSSQAASARGRALVNGRAVARGRALVNGYPLVNAYPLVNGYPLVNAIDTIADSSEVVLVFDEDDIDTTSTDTVYSFSPINLITGTDVGTHAIVPGPFLNSNYSISYELGNLTITPANLIATANDTSKVYGKPNPAFEISYDGLVDGDSISDITPPSISSTAVDSSSVGFYPISLSGGSADNYNLILIDGMLTINPADVYVSARDTFMNQGAAIPSFQYDLWGDIYQNDQITANPTLTLDPGYNSAAGAYAIIPSGLQINNMNNYQVHYTNGTLYVNPLGIGTHRILLDLDCVEEITNHPSGFEYVAHITYTNQNSTPVYIPVGNNNMILSGGQNSGDPTEVFQPGVGYKDIYFDGSGFLWYVFSNQNNYLSYSLMYASRNSQQCILAKKTSSVVEHSDRIDWQPMVYPNPVRDQLTIQALDTSSAYDIHIYTITGKKINDNYNLSRTVSGNYQVDFSMVHPGIYMIIVQHKEERFTYKVIKE